MAANATYSQHVNDNIQAELIYEESPVFVGGEENALSAIVRFKYVGEIPKASEVEEQQPVPAQSTNGHENNKENTGNGWLGGLGKRISVQLSNSTRNLLLQELETLDENSEDKFKDETLLLGYTQVFGYYTYNDQVFDPKKFEEIQKKSIIGGKLAGINELGFDDKNDEGFLNNFASGFGSIFSSGLIPDDLEDDDKKLYNPKKDIVPLFTTNQSILFPEIVFKPASHEGLTNSFYMTVKLPKFLPPSYVSISSISIHYNLIIGYQILDDNNRWCNKSLFFPLEIRPYVNGFGQQPNYDLLNPVLGHVVKQKSFALPNNETNFKDIKRKLPINRKRNSTMSISTFNNEIGSNDNLDKGLSNGNGNGNTKKKFLEFIHEMNDKDVNDLIGVQEKFENEFLNYEGKSQPDRENVKENLIKIFNNPATIAAKIKEFNETPHEVTTAKDEPKEYHSQIPVKPQLNFILKRNGELITTISLSKSIITFNEILKIHLSFKNSKVPITGLITKLMKIEKFNDSDYLKGEDEVVLDVELNSSFEFETGLNEQLTSCFNVNDELSYDMLIPNDLVRTGQFKSNLLETRYCLLFKFILLDKEIKKVSTEEANEDDNNTNKTDSDTYEFTEIYKDSKGSLYRGVDYISNGMEFYCKIPIILLSSYERDFGTKIGI